MENLFSEEEKINSEDSADYENAWAGWNETLTDSPPAKETVSFRYADLTGADLSNRDWSHVDFSYATLSGADFTNSIIIGANFSYATMVGAKLRNVRASGSAEENGSTEPLVW